MKEQANQIVDKLSEVCNERLVASKQEHIFVDQAFARLKEIINQKQEDDKDTPEEE